MPPIEVELKDGWAIGARTEQDRKKTIQPGETVTIKPVHNIDLEVGCAENDVEGFVKVTDSSFGINIIEEDSDVKINPEARDCISLVKKTIMKIYTMNGVELAEIKHSKTQPDQVVKTGSSAKDAKEEEVEVE